MNWELVIKELRQKCIDRVSQAQTSPTQSPAQGRHMVVACVLHDFADALQAGLNNE